jgi:hypothetical protein
VRVPSERLWVEWAETPRQEVLGDILGVKIEPAVTGGRAGVLISADAGGRTGTIRTFWSAPDDSAYCAALITDFDLNLPIRNSRSMAEVFNGASVGLSEPYEPAIDAFFSHICFRFDPAWSDYYRSANLSIDQQTAVLCTELGSTAFAIPMLFALFLLLAAKDAAMPTLAPVDCTMNVAIPRDPVMASFGDANPARQCAAGRNAIPDGRTYVSPAQSS